MMKKVSRPLQREAAEQDEGEELLGQVCRHLCSRNSQAVCGPISLSGSTKRLKKNKQEKKAQERCSQTARLPTRPAGGCATTGGSRHDTTRESQLASGLRRHPVYTAHLCRRVCPRTHTSSAPGPSNLQVSRLVRSSTRPAGAPGRRAAAGRRAPPLRSRLWDGTRSGAPRFRRVASSTTEG